MLIGSFSHWRQKLDVNINVFEVLRSVWKMCNKKHIPRFSQIKLGYCTLSSDSLVGWIWWFERLSSKHSVSTSRHKLCRNVSQHDPESSRLFPRCRGALTPWWFIICYVTARGESISQWDSAAEVRTLVLFTLLFALRWRRITTGRFKIWIFHLTTFDSVWPSQSCRRSRWSLCLSGWVLKRLQVIFPHTNITEAPSVLSWRNIMSEVMTGRCFCARHTAGGAERTTWKSSCPWTVEHTLILYNTLWQDRLIGRAGVLLSEGRWFNSHRHTWMYELLLLWTYVAI